MTHESSRRRVIPYALNIRGEYINLIAYDTRDGLTKQFIINCISELDWNFYSEFIYSQDKSKFNLNEYENSELGNFYREEVEYKLQFSEFSFRHFTNRYDLNYENLEKLNQNIICKIKTTDWYAIQKILFQYNIYIKLLAPQEKVAEFQWNIKSLQDHYV